MLFVPPQSASNARRLVLFDFDGTLIRSPEAPKWWPSRGGWWSRAESLLPPILPKVPPAHCWIEETLKAAENALADEETLCILATGRLDDVFAERVSELLSAVGLDFHAVLLARRCGKGTLDQKIELIDSVLDACPRITDVQIFEDRSPHHAAFKAHLERHGRAGRLAAYDVTLVQAKRYVPKVSRGEFLRAHPHMERRLSQR